MPPVNRRAFLGTAAAAVGGAAIGVGATLGVTAAQGAGLQIAPAGPPSSTAWLAANPSNVATLVDGLDTIVAPLLRRTGIPGVAVAVVHGGDVIYAKGFGVRKVGTKEAVSPYTVFQVASVSKSLSATVVAAAVARGIVAWDDPVIRHLPEFALSDTYASENVTLADLFSHRSGLPDHAGDLLEDLGYDQAQVIERLRYYPLTPLRTHYAYTNFGLTAAGIAVARAAGMSWAQLCSELLFQPAGMDHSSMLFSAYESSPLRAWGHVQQNGVWKAAVRDPDAQAPAGGVSSTAHNMARWMSLVLGNGKLDGQQVVPGDQLTPVRTPHSLASPPRTAADRSGMYGLGMNVGSDPSGRATLSHSGAFATSVGSAYTLLPAENLGIVTLTNGMAIGVAEAINQSAMDVIETGQVRADWFALYNEHAFAPMYVNHSTLAGKKPQASPAPAPAASALVGQYGNALYGPATVAAVGTGLVVKLGPKQTPYPLTHWDGPVFSYQPTGENAVGIAAVTFAASEGGTAPSVTLENLQGEDEAHPLGVFARA